MLQPGGREPRPEAQRSLDQLERLLSKFEAMDLRLEDLEGELHDAGMTMKVTSSEPMEGIGREVIKETYKPGIYRGRQVLQTPEVIIGLPVIERGTKKVSSTPAEPNTADKVTTGLDAKREPKAEHGQNVAVLPVNGYVP